MYSKRVKTPLAIGTFLLITWTPKNIYSKKNQKKKTDQSEFESYRPMNPPVDWEVTVLQRTFLSSCCQRCIRLHISLWPIIWPDLQVQEWEIAKYDSKIVVNFYCTFNYWTNATGCIDMFMSRRTTGLFLVRLYEQSVRFNNYVNPRVCGKDICPWANRSWLSAIWNPRGDRMQIRRRVQSWTNASRSERLALLIKWSIRHKNISLKNWVNALLYNK